MLRNTLAVALLSAASLSAHAQCAATVEGNDAMQFNVKEIIVDKTCTEFSVTLKHVGKLPKAAMGHNWILTKEADFQATSAAGMAAGAANDYIPQNDARIIAHTKMLGGGENDTVKIDVSKLAAGQNYTYFCSFPGHFAIMKGTLKLSS